MVGFGCCGEEIKIPGKLYEAMTKGGWLDEDGICHLNEEDQAHPSGSIAPPGFWNRNPSEKQIEEAIQKGWIKFIDGNGDKTKAMTKAAYVTKYPNYWPPDLVLRMLGRFPPRFIRIGRY